MAGIYFHIPFCKQACHYCDFHFSTSIKYKGELLEAMAKELQLQSAFLNTRKISTIYFGGGTPSVLDAHEISYLLDETSRYFDIERATEITLEANPDDLDKKKVEALRETPISRFSIGIQSFFDEDLKWMNRVHTAQEADSAIKRVQDAGFEDLTADLIYGYPLLSDEKWLSNILKLAGLSVPHISAYSMTVEPRTALAHFIKVGAQKNMDEEQATAQFLQLIETLSSFSYEHYEISNFAFPNRYAKHNTNYWRSEPYLGIGPSAHSFDGTKRQWNINNNGRYIAEIGKNNVPAEVELLSTVNQINEYIMTSLRTMWGLDLDRIQNLYGPAWHDAIVSNAQRFEEENKLFREQDHLKLTTAGKLMADFIASELFIEDEDEHKKD